MSSCRYANTLLRFMHFALLCIAAVCWVLDGTASTATWQHCDKLIYVLIVCSIIKVCRAGSTNMFTVTTIHCSLCTLCLSGLQLEVCNSSLRQYRDLSITQVLGTDMKKHFDIVSRFQVCRLCMWDQNSVESSTVKCSWWHAGIHCLDMPSPCMFTADWTVFAKLGYLYCF